jgi:hypothetical protein
MEVRKLNIRGKTYYGNCVHSPDDGGYYIEIWHMDSPGEWQTGICETEAKAWVTAKSMLYQVTS